MRAALRSGARVRPAARRDDDLVVLVVGAKDGYVERDGHLVDPERDLERRQAFGSYGPPSRRRRP